MSADIAAHKIEELRNEIARLKGQTNWVCACGGTDCEGRKENAKLRAHAERVGQANDRLAFENDALRKALEDMPTCRCGLSTDEQCALSVENAALRGALAIESERSLYWRNIAGRKEA